jgi:hypothetical protein
MKFIFLLILLCLLSNCASKSLRRVNSSTKGGEDKVFIKEITVNTDPQTIFNSETTIMFIDMKEIKNSNFKNVEIYIYQ